MFSNKNYLETDQKPVLALESLVDQKKQTLGESNVIARHPVKRNWLKAVMMKGKAQPIMHHCITDQSVETLQGQVSVLLFRDSLPNA